MHRRTLTLRRFGPMSFGLGYFEEGVWVDHSNPVAGVLHELAPGSELRPGDEPMDVVHQWFTCCTDPITDVPVALHPHIGVVPEDPLAMSSPAAWEASGARKRASQR